VKPVVEEKKVEIKKIKPVVKPAKKKIEIK